MCFPSSANLTLNLKPGPMSTAHFDTCPGLYNNSEYRTRGVVSAMAQLTGVAASVSWKLIATRTSSCASHRYNNTSRRRLRGVDVRGPLERSTVVILEDEVGVVD